MAFNKLLGAVDAALLQDVVARSHFDQYRNIAACGNRNAHLGNGNVEDLLRIGIDLQPVLRHGFFGQFFQMNNQAEIFLQLDCGFPEQCTDIQHAEAAHLEKILQHGRAAAFQRVRRHLVEFHDIVGNQAMPARDQFQRQFAFSLQRCRR